MEATIPSTFSFDFALVTLMFSAASVSITTYGSKFVENIVQAVSRNLLCFAMKPLRHCFIVGHVHDELINECSPDVDIKAIFGQMGKSSDWMPDIMIRGDGYATPWRKKD